MSAHFRDKTVTGLHTMWQIEKQDKLPQVAPSIHIIDLNKVY